MKRAVGITLISLSIVFVFFTGCQNQQIQQEAPVNIESPSEKQARLIAIENVQLKEQIRELNKQLADQRKIYEKNTQKLKAFLKSVQKENADLKSILQKDSEWQELEKFTSDMFTTIDADNENLRKENERLRSEVELLTTKIEELSGKVEN